MAANIPVGALKNKWVIGGLIVAGAVGYFVTPVREFVSGLVHKNSHEAQMAEWAKEKERETLRNPYKSPRNPETERDLGAYAGEYAKLRGHIQGRAQDKGLKSDQIGCVLQGYDSALSLAVKDFPLNVEGALGKENAKGFLGSLDYFGKSKMDVCVDKADVPEEFAESLKAQVFSRDGAVAQQLFPGV